ncbi:hypothetical protein AKJ09_08576 [Labilithrix luteola]|uniref:Uncharacterized protein n=1 Tax=Labilithrix luteola TaxID=1391654 RepID=A0A0K1Q847_9BACT|nr:hypothetical protein AKJ09_08576 [Labilithrix luteola]
MSAFFVFFVLTAPLLIVLFNVSSWVLDFIPKVHALAITLEE